MQLRPFVIVATLLLTRGALAQVVQVDTTHELFFEAPVASQSGPPQRGADTHMFVYSPSVKLTANPSNSVSIYGGWEADIVSGASVKLKAGSAYQATHSTADVVTTASVNDFRNVGKGGFTVKHDNTSFGAGGLYGTENDYHSVSFNVMARTELFEHNTQLQIDYAHNFDSVCDLVQDPATTPVGHIGLPDSKGCFTSDITKTTHDIAIDSFQGSWSQSWTPTFQMQAVYTLQIVNGFQSDPYREVVLGEGVAAQEYVPENRMRHAIALRASLFSRGFKGAFRFGVRGYRDSWNIWSGEANGAIEKYFGSSFRAEINGRIYKQTGAIFWSDDYTGGNPPLGPKGQYFTGDRELSPFVSVGAGVKLTYATVATEKKLLGFMTSFRFVVAANLMNFFYDEYTLGGVPISNALAYILNLGLSAGF